MVADRGDNAPGVKGKPLKMTDITRDHDHWPMVLWYSMHNNNCYPRGLVWSRQRQDSRLDEGHWL